MRQQIPRQRSEKIIKLLHYIFHNKSIFKRREAATHQDGIAAIDIYNVTEAVFSSVAISYFFVG